jgi:hypothetical protein
MSGPCIAQLSTGSRSEGWVISANYQTIFDQSDLAGPPFVRAGAGTPSLFSGFFQRTPIFGCTSDTIYLEVFQGDFVTVATKNFLKNGAWAVAFTNQLGLLFGPSNSFPSPDSLLGSVNFLTATAFLTQGDRIAMLGDFANGNRKSSRAYDLSSGKNHLFNFVGLEASSITNACITAKTLWFMVTVGTFQELFEVDSNGNLTLIAAVSNGGTIGFSCGADRAALDIQAAGTLK